MAIKYNPYGWEIRPKKTEKDETIEREYRMQELEKKIDFLSKDISSRIESFLEYRHDTMTILRLMENTQKLIEELAILRIRHFGYTVGGII